MATLSRPARLKIRVESGRPSEKLVCCGWMDCGTRVAWVEGAPFTSDRLGMSPHGHEIRWDPGFRRGADGIMRLTPHVERRWRRAKRQGDSWTEFVAQPGPRQRRPYTPGRHRPGAVADSPATRGYSHLDV